MYFYLCGVRCACKRQCFHQNCILVFIYLEDTFIQPTCFTNSLDHKFEVYKDNEKMMTMKKPACVRARVCVCVCV